MAAQQDEQTPVVSVVIPTNNRKNWVTEALESVFNQSYTDYEVIVVDDGSSDGTSEHLRERFGDRIRLFRTEGTNCPTAKNHGASHARGKYLAFLDDDDRWYPEKLEKQVAFMEAAEADVAMVGSACDYMTQEGRPTWKPTFPDEFLTYENACVKPNLPGASSGCLIRRSVYQDLGGFDTSLTRNQDRELWMRITKSYNVPMMQDILSTVRLHEKQRRGVSTEVIERCRMEINSRIPEYWLRRKANAWTYFHLGNLNWKERKMLSFIFYVKSFISYPFSLPIDVSRSKAFLKKLLRRR